MVHPVQSLSDRHSTNRLFSHQRSQQRKVGVAADHPRDIRDGLVLGGCAGAEQHVWFGIDPDHSPNVRGDRCRQLPCATAEIDDEIVARQRERIDARADQPCRITAAVSVIQLSNLATKPQIHRLRMPPPVDDPTGLLPPA